MSKYGTAGLDVDEEAGRASAGGSRSVSASARGKGDGKVAFSMKTSAVSFSAMLVTRQLITSSSEA